MRGGEHATSVKRERAIRLLRKKHRKAIEKLTEQPAIPLTARQQAILKQIFTPDATITELQLIASIINTYVAYLLHEIEH
jgi:hypothetical protein